ncbi:MAG TPA: hypothetical protein VJT73_06665, partial [Polyangiaceae bacterium]|nr:hypothetical protein [Polyangiaceae bacterium]
MLASHRFSFVISFYGGLCRKVLADRRLFAGFAFASMLHALGHSATALVAGLLGRALVTEPPLISSTFRFLSSPATLAFVGLTATSIKGLGATLGATMQSRLAQNVATQARQRVAASLLRCGS